MTASLQEKKQGNKNFYYVVLSYKDKGKWKTKWVSTHLEVKGNKKEAKNALIEIVQKYSYLENDTTINKNIKFCDYVKHFMEYQELRVKAKEIETSTFEGYKTYSKHIIEYFSKKNIKLVFVTSKDINDYIKYQKEFGKVNKKTQKREPLAISSIRSQKSLLYSIFLQAIIDNLITTNPCDGIKVGTKNSDISEDFDGGFMDLEEFKEFLRYVKEKDPRFYHVVVIGGFGGLRRSEMAGLKWKHINFKKKELVIKDAIVRIETEYEKGTKTSTSNRKLPILEIIEETLLDLQKEQKAYKAIFGKDYNDNDYVFKWEDGHTFALDYFSKHFKKLAKSYSRDDMTLHKLRHTCCSILSIDLNMPLKEVQQWLGHSDMSTTMNIYMHAKKARKSDIKRIESINNAIGKI